MVCRATTWINSRLGQPPKDSFGLICELKMKGFNNTSCGLTPRANRERQ